MGNSNSGRRPEPLDEQRISDLAFLGLEYRQIARELGIHHTRIHRRCRELVEARRRDRFPALVAALRTQSLHPVIIPDPQ